MRHNCTFFKNVCSIEIPVALQSMLQSSFNVVEQLNNSLRLLFSN